MKKIIAILFIVTSICLFASISTFAAETDQMPVVSAENIVAVSGSEVMVNISIDNNIGILSTEIMISWDERLELTAASAGDAFAALNYTPPSYYRNPTNFLWDAEKIEDEDIKDGVVLTLTFSVSENTKGQDLGIYVTCGDTFDKDLNEVNLKAENGMISVVTYIPGDVNGDDKINTQDITLIRRYISDGRVTDPSGYNVTLNKQAADVNDDGNINTLDITLIRRYISDGRVTDPNGYNVTLKPSKERGDHQLRHVAAVDATYTEMGNEEYWICDECGKYFIDNAGKYELPGEPIVDVKKYTVMFLDYDDSVLSIQLVEINGKATAPEDSLERANYVFVNWDKDFTNVTEDLIVRAQYERQYTVTFLNYDGEVLDTQTVTSGESAAPPVAPSILGYNFIGWDNSYSDITADTTIYAQYEIQQFKVTFKMPDGSVIQYVDSSGETHDFQMVEYGSFAEVPLYSDTFPEMYFDWNENNMKCFSGWDEDITNITQDIEIQALYENIYHEPVIAIEAIEHNEGTLKLAVKICMPENIYLYAIDFGFEWSGGSIGITGCDVDEKDNIAGLYRPCAGDNCNAKYNVDYNNKETSFHYMWTCGSGHSLSNGGKYFSVCEINFAGYDGMVPSIDILQIFEDCTLIYANAAQTGMDDLVKINPIVVMR